MDNVKSALSTFANNVFREKLTNVPFVKMITNLPEIKNVTKIQKIVKTKIVTYADLMEIVKGAKEVTEKTHQPLYV